MELLLFGKGFLFGIITSLPIGGASFLIMREAYMKGKSSGTSLVLIPLSIDWMSTIITLFFLHEQSGKLVIVHPASVHLFQFLARNADGVLACLFGYIGLRVWRESRKTHKMSGDLNVRRSVISAALVNFFTIPAAILFYFSTIFSTHEPIIFEKILFIGAMIAGGIITWTITFWKVVHTRNQNINFDLHKTNARFAYAIWSVAIIALAKEIIHIF